MKIHRIRLRNYRGVEDRTVEPDPVGVTVVEGPNEVGKSSIAEALDLVLDNLDSSKSRSVRAVKPVDRDVGPEVEVDLEMGAYRLLLRKRFLRRPETVLKVSSPVPENLTGREAHERVRDIISRTLDTDLWRAVRVIQDAGVDRVKLEDASSLAQALDRAAGGDVAGDKEVCIFEAVHEEYGKYFTDTGSPRKPLNEADASVEEAARAVDSLERDLETIDQLVGASDRLSREVRELSQYKADSIGTAEKHEVTVVALEKQEADVERLKAVRDQASSEEDRQVAAHKARQDLIAVVKEGLDTVDRLRGASAESTSAVTQASGEEQKARDRLRKAERVAEECAESAALAARDVEHHGNQFDLKLLVERRDRIRKHEAARGKAAAFLDKCTVDSRLVGRLRKAENDLIRVQAQLDAGSPRVRVIALDPISLQTGRKTRKLKKGESYEEIVGERRTLRIPSVAKVEVSAGTSLDTLVKERDTVQKRLDKFLLEAAVPSVADAEAAELRRRDAQAQVDTATEAIEVDLRDLTMEEMLAKISRLEAKVVAYPSTRVAKPELPKNLDEAKSTKAEADNARDSADKDARSAKAHHDAAEVHLRKLERQLQETDNQVRIQEQLQLKDQRALDIARTHRSDAALEKALKDARQSAADGTALWEEAKKELTSKDPGRVRSLARNARAAADRASRELREKEDELNRTQAKLDVLGGKGVFEELEAARTRLEHARVHQRAVGNRAAAARLLFETMRRRRNEARRAYAAPLREKIVQLGRLVYGESFDVELDDNLGVEKRSLGGVTLPFTSISVGAREQLGLIVRVACSLLVDKQEGVPLLFDDTLGHTDPSRLEGMGAMLSRAGRQCQVIIFTCTPGRFRHIGDARTIALSGTG